MLKNSFIIFSLLVLTLSLVPANVFAKENGEVKIDQRNSGEIRKILNNIRDKDPQKPETKGLNKDNKNQLSSNQRDLQIKFNLKNKKIKLQNKDKGDIQIGIPESQKMDSVDIVDNRVIYSGKESKTDIIVESIDGGIRQIINIKDSTAPNFYDFPVDLEKDDNLILNKDGSAAVIRPYTKEEKEKIPKNVPEGIEIPDKTAKLLIAKPWAKDANGKDLKTWYTIAGNNLRQNIDLNGAVFPVVADPIWCGNAINSVNWIRRNDMWSASVNPTWCGAWGSVQQPWDAWVEAYNKTNSCARWSGWTCIARPWNKQWNTNQYWSMYNQFVCHAEFARGWKPDWVWNLEPARPDRGYLGFIQNNCN